MITRTLSKRLRKLESRLAPNDESRIIHIVYVSPDGTRKAGYTVGGRSEARLSAAAERTPAKVS
jgi:hypothetical protein